MSITEHCEEILPYGAPREEWLRVRRLGLGGSDCSGVMGMSKYASPYTVWEDKTGRGYDVDETELMRWGNLLEPVIRAEAMDRLGLTYSMPGTLRSLQRPWQQGNLDGLASDGGIIECKNTGQWMAGDWNEQIPDHAELQVQHNMSVSGAPHAWVLGLVGGCRLHIACIERDDEVIELINNEEWLLWRDHVLTDIAPPMDPSEATRAALVRRFGLESRVIELADEDAVAAIAAVDAREAGRIQERDGAAVKKQAENELRLLLAGANEATVAGQTIVKFVGGTWAPKKFEEAEPELAALYRHKVDVVDSKALRAAEPEVWRRYQAQNIKTYPFVEPKGA
uniref:YqaJ viral recombinase family nuclease n=1 Tax=Micromonospora sp. NBC_00855 TaxID=2975978 RepID=UPI00224CC1BD|nr:YqaJ viral recombinase family protein [Micromonospora sp. NBC_00855]